MPFVWRKVEVSEEELARERQGLILGSEVMRRLGISRLRLAALVRSGDLGHVNRLGVDYYSAGDVADIQDGRSPGEMRRAESARFKAEWEAALPSGASTARDVPTPQTVEPGQDFLRKFGGGR